MHVCWMGVPFISHVSLDIFYAQVFLDLSKLDINVELELLPVDIKKRFHRGGGNLTQHETLQVPINKCSYLEA